MSDEQTIETFEALQQLGFKPDPRVMSDLHPGLSYDFGNFKLNVVFGTSPRHGQAAYFGGVLNTPRTVAMVEFAIALSIESREQCAAWIVYHLDQVADGYFIPAIETPWLDEGRAHQDLLPWIRRQNAYKARPGCSVERDWLRVALKKLAAVVAGVTDDCPVEISFRDDILSIRCDGQLIAMPASGRSWGSAYSIPAGQLRSLPKGLQQEVLWLDVWESRLGIADRAYAGVVEVSEASMCDTDAARSGS